MREAFDFTATSQAPSQTVQRLPELQAMQLEDGESSPKRVQQKVQPEVEADIDSTSAAAAEVTQSAHCALSTSIPASE